MAYKRILTIQDISCVGQCSMTVALPILSACGHETCILPTALLSTHTGGFGKPEVVHFGDALPGIYRHWMDCGIAFDAILVGYLGSTAAVSSAMEILENMLVPGGVSIVDPAMADHGRLYSGLDMEYAEAVGRLCARADVILPNITEAALLTGMEFMDFADDCYVNQLLDKIENTNVILTGVGFAEGQTGVMLKEGALRQYYTQDRVGASFHGTGDIFAAAFTGTRLQGFSSFDALKIAADFTRQCIVKTVENPVHWYGIRFEEELPWLIEKLR